MDKETYLGGGLYASFDGYSIWLRAPRMGGDHRVALEPEIFCALIEFERGLRAAPIEEPSP